MLIMRRCQMTRGRASWWRRPLQKQACWAQTPSALSMYACIPVLITCPLHGIVRLVFCDFTLCRNSSLELALGSMLGQLHIRWSVNQIYV